MPYAPLLLGVSKNWKTPFVYVELPLPLPHALDYNVMH